ncbi:MAG: 4Fe-4S dicluster domain-containing protein [Chloroflexi bacterium]|nr:4Fe-4S dicluster domain-containing protein [Chloroflexota bacterium]
MLTPKIVIRPKLCTGCRLCESTCALYNEKVNNPTRSRIQVMKQHSFGLFTPVMCYQCKEPPCVPPCPVDAIKRDPETGVTNIDYDLCIGCEQCAAACPFGAIITLPDKVVKCDLCKGDPQCVKYCETKAIEYKSPFQAYHENRAKRGEIAFSNLAADYGLPEDVPNLVRK